MKFYTQDPNNELSDVEYAASTLRNKLKVNIAPHRLTAVAASIIHFASRKNENGAVMWDFVELRLALNAMSDVASAVRLGLSDPAWEEAARYRIPG